MGRARGFPASPTGQERWPPVSMRWVPSEGPDSAPALAERVRRAVWGLEPTDAVPSLSALLEAGNFDCLQTKLGADRGGTEAIMFPGARGRLHIRVDPRPPTRQAVSNETLRHRTRFRVAHEVAHSFFYDRLGARSQRRRRSSAAEELFCDAFASALLIPPSAAAQIRPQADSVLVLQRRYDTSVEVAARALCGAHPDLDLVLAYDDRSEPNSGDEPKLAPQWASERLGEHAEAACAASLGRPTAGHWSSLSTACTDRAPQQMVAAGRFEAAPP